MPARTTPTRVTSPVRHCRAVHANRPRAALRALLAIRVSRTLRAALMAVLGCALPLCATLMVPDMALGASAAAVSQNEGYSGHVMDKVLAVWSPPASRDDRQLRLRVSLDGEGRVLECKPVKASGLPALDSSACAAVREAAPFGTPPYGMPLDVYFSFWTGTPKAQKGVRQSAQPAPAAPAAAAPADSQSRAAALAAETATHGQAAASPAPAAAAAQPAAAQASSGHAAASGSHLRAQDKYDARFQRYLSGVVWKLRNAMYIPAQTRPGTYYATAQVRLNQAGKIMDAHLLRGSGDAMLDKYVLQGIRRAGAVTPPPAGLGDTLDLTFTLTRQ